MAGRFAAHRWAFVVILGLFVAGGFFAVAGERDAASGGWLWALFLLTGVLLGLGLYHAMRKQAREGPGHGRDPRLP